MTVADLEAKLRSAHACAFSASLFGALVTVGVHIKSPHEHPALVPVPFHGEGSSIEEALADALRKAGIA